MAPELGSIEVRMSDEDRDKYGGTEWVKLDLDELWKTPSVRLERWEEELGGTRSIAMAVGLTARGRVAPAWAKRAVLWLARKQSGQNRANGTAESFAFLADIQAMHVLIRDHEDPNAPTEIESEEVDGDDPPGQATSEPGTPPT